MGIKHDDKLCGMEYEIALYDIERNLFAMCQDVNEAKKTLSQWRDTGSQRKDITIVNYRNPNEIFKDVFSSSVKQGKMSHSLEVCDTRKTKSYKAIEVKNKEGKNKTYYLEMRMSVLRDIKFLSEAVLLEVQRRYDTTAEEVFIPDEIYESVKKAKSRI